MFKLIGTVKCSKLIDYDSGGRASGRVCIHSLDGFCKDRLVSVYSETYRALLFCLFLYF